MHPAEIAEKLNALEIRTIKNNPWTGESVKNILRNEKYCGDVLMQKTYTVDCLTHKTKKNEGEVEQYFIPDHHPAIVEREVWDKAQVRLEQIAGKRRRIRPKQQRLIPLRKGVLLGFVPIRPTWKAVSFKRLETATEKLMALVDAKPEQVHIEYESEECEMEILKGFEVINLKQPKQALGDRAAVSSANLVLMGIEPTYPSEKYGYIIPIGTEQVSKVSMFKEKPTQDVAKDYISKGALWNGGVFAFRLGYVLNRAHELIDFADYDDLFNKYDTLNKISFDYAVVEHEPEIEVMRFAGTWKDLGTWNTLTEAMDSHAVGEALFNEKCENVHVVNELDVPVLCMGLKNIVVSASPEGILVSDKEQSSYIKGGQNLVEDFANCSSSESLVFAGLVTVGFLLLLYLPRRVIGFKDFMNSVPEGGKLMMPAILILVLAWTLKGMTDALGIGTFVRSAINLNSGLMNFVPLIIFCIAIFIAFSSGTSWGTFAILVPIVVNMFAELDPTMMIISVAAVLAGAVCGDHISPISDTTIMSSSGAQSNHINHVQTQMQYAFVVIAVCLVGYLIAGFTENWWLTLLCSLVILTIVLLEIRKRSNAAAAKELII